MRMYLIAAVLVGFIVGVVLGCASSSDVPAAVAEEIAGAKYQVVAGTKSDGNTVFLRYDVNSGEAWTWAPVGARNWVPLTESE